MLKLNIGCGKDIKKGYVNLDQHLDNGADKIYVLPHIYLEDYTNFVRLGVKGEMLPYKDNSVDEIYCSHVLEDFLYEFEFIMRDFHRVLKPGGLLHIKVPYKASYGSFYHKRFFDKNTFKGLVNQNELYQDKGMFSDIIMNHVNRYGVGSCVLLFLISRLGNKKQQKTYSKIYNSYEKQSFWKKLYKLDPKIGYAYELEVKLIK